MSHIQNALKKARFGHPSPNLGEGLGERAEITPRVWDSTENRYNAGDPTLLPNDPKTDQRGTRRVKGGRADMGAFEFS